MDSVAAGLVALGHKKGDRIGVWGQNHLEWIITMYAAAKAGLILVFYNSTFPILLFFKHLRICFW